MKYTKNNLRMWDIAYENTITILSERGYSTIYENACKNCNSTKYKDTTMEMQRLGNCMQRIVVCECDKLFIEEWI